MKKEKETNKKNSKPKKVKKPKVERTPDYYFDGNQIRVSPSKLLKSRIIRWVVFIVGFISFILGTVGIIFPVLPTTPFYLLAAFCFVRSSSRFANWFLNSALYKRHLENFANSKAMILKNELILLLSVSAFLCVTMVLLDIPVMNIIFPILIGCKYLYFCWQVRPINRVEYEAMMIDRKIMKERAVIMAKRRRLGEENIKNDVNESGEAN